MNARAFLVRGLIAGLIAGLATFFVAHQVGEPHVDTAIALEEAGEPAAVVEEHTHSHDDGEEAHTHSHGEDAEVSRSTQRTWGLLTGSLAVGLALGGLVALVSAGLVGRIGRFLPGQTVALVSLLGFVSFALVPFLKYPSTPPAVGSGDTIGDRTALYFGFVAVSLIAAVAATYVALRLRDRIGTYGGTVVGVAGYLVVMVVAGQVFGTVNEIGDFPADVLWYFRRASLITLATMWGVLGVVLTGLVAHLYRQDTAEAERRALAASL
ncbi:CbtA family protein [Nocardioides sp. SR21]|uniref:CbtA family protein n=1 Tax=Nocardioides sp. SR21 TaxID=2919501 RepID=UPI001FAA340A|nr:CbtA family protein [Nocardioides sp. SR21]